MGVSKRKTSKRKTRGKKRSRLSSSARGAYDYAMSNPGNVAGGALGLAGLGVGLGEGYYALRRGLRTSDASPQYLSPTARAIRGVRDYNYRAAGSGLLDRIMPSRIKKRQQKAAEAEAEAEAIRQRNAIYGEKRAGIDRKRMEASPEHRQKSAAYMQLLKSDFARNDAARRSKMAQLLDYGKRRRRKRKSSFGKKVKKPSAATKRMCKKLKVRLTVKRGGKRVYKSEKVLKKQCKTAMKRKKKKSKK